MPGGTGFLGGWVARALLGAGHRMRLLGRDFSRAGALLAAGRCRGALEAVAAATGREPVLTRYSAATLAALRGV